MKLFLLLLIVFSVSCDTAVYKKSSLQLGTVINLTMVSDSQTAEKASQSVFQEIKRLETMLSPYKKQSDIYRVNTHAAKKRIAIAAETRMLIKTSLDISRKTGGAFDISFASMSHIWNFRKKPFIPPSKQQVLNAKRLVNYRNIILGKKDVFFKRAGMKIGLGGIAKGYAIKRAVEVLKQHGVKAGIVDEGGDLQVFGDKFGKAWRTGVVHPRKKELLLVVQLEDMDAIATSGDYERYAEYNNKKYHHIIDPHTGYPARMFASVSIITKDPVLSDSYATAVFVMGLDKAKTFLQAHPECGSIIVGLKGAVYITKNIKDKIIMMPKKSITWL